MAEIVNVDAFEDAGDDAAEPAEPATESKLEGRWGSSGWDDTEQRKSDYESHARPEPINQRVKSLLRGSGSWRQGTQRNIGSQKDQGLLNDSFFSNVEDVLFDDDPGGYDSEESVEEVFEAIEGIYCPPLTLKEHEWYCTHVLNLHKETKSSWDELFFDLALVAAFGSLASCLTLSSESDVHHRRLSSSDVHMSFPRAVFLYCLETATVISVRRFTDGHRAQWRRNDLFGSLLLLGRAICCLGMGGARPASLGLRASRRWRLALSESPCERRCDGVPVSAASRRWRIRGLGHGLGHRLGCWLHDQSSVGSRLRSGLGRKLGRPGMGLDAICERHHTPSTRERPTRHRRDSPSIFTQARRRTAMHVSGSSTPGTRSRTVWGCGPSPIRS
mmetsp:Transcript_20382/g.62996  ORF Transcript_20382/g.62996 Transcript_20382/m.62996 type:complete len:388 (+) Transcript_20382:222-1385(+)